MRKFLRYVLDRLKERSTWLGLISALTAIGVTFSTAQSEAIIAVGVALAGAIAVFTRDVQSK